MGWNQRRLVSMGPWHIECHGLAQRLTVLRGYCCTQRRLRITVARREVRLYADSRGGPGELDGPPRCPSDCDNSRRTRWGRPGMECRADPAERRKITRWSTLVRRLIVPPNDRPWPIVQEPDASASTCRRARCRREKLLTRFPHHSSTTLARPSHRLHSAELRYAAKDGLPLHSRGPRQ